MFLLLPSDRISAMTDDALSSETSDEYLLDEDGRRLDASSATAAVDSQKSMSQVERASVPAATQLKTFQAAAKEAVAVCLRDKLPAPLGDDTEKVVSPFYDQWLEQVLASC